MDGGVPRAQDRGMQPSEREMAASSLPELLAEYGRLAVQLPGAGPDHAAWLQHRLAELDAVIDEAVASLGAGQV